MPFFLLRGGRNVPLEVQRWQYFLLKQNILQVGQIDGNFGPKRRQKFFNSSITFRSRGDSMQ